MTTDRELAEEIERNGINGRDDFSIEVKEQIIAALRRESGDYVMVPREPTEAQRHLAMMNDSPSYRTSSLVFYCAMLTAAEASKEAEGRNG